MSVLPYPSVTVVIPTLTAGPVLEDCLDSLTRQTFRDFEIIVVDNSGRGAVPEGRDFRVIRNGSNAGFAAAVNQGIRASESPYIATLNDDAAADPEWLEAIVAAIARRHEIGMCASQVRLAGDGRLDSAGMLICADGSSKQRGHLSSPDQFPRCQEVLLPSGSAALYKREMLEEIGLFDESFFLYCEDTDLGLRARWAAWECLYVPEAIVEHRYSHSAGRASPLKAFYVERNRLYLAAKNFPVPLLCAVPFYAAARYFWHLVYGIAGRGAAGAFIHGGNSSFDLPLSVLRAHVALFRNARRLWRERRRIRRRLTSTQFRRLLRQYSITPRKVAAL